MNILYTEKIIVKRLKLLIMKKVKNVSMNVKLAIKKKMSRQDFEDMLHGLNVDNGCDGRKVFYASAEEHKAVQKGLAEFFKSGYYTLMLASVGYGVWPLDDGYVAYVSFE